MFKIKLSDGCEIIAKSNMDAITLAEWLNENYHTGDVFTAWSKEDGNTIIIRISDIDMITTL